MSLEIKTNYASFFISQYWRKDPEDLNTIKGNDSARFIYRAVTQFHRKTFATSDPEQLLCAKDQE